jgi:hypothetical protein
LTIFPADAACGALAVALDAVDRTTAGDTAQITRIYRLFVEIMASQGAFRTDVGDDRVLVVVDDSDVV